MKGMPLLDGWTFTWWRCFTCSNSVYQIKRYHNSDLSLTLHAHEVKLIIILLLLHSLAPSGIDILERKIWIYPLSHVSVGAQNKSGVSYIVQGIHTEHGPCTLPSDKCQRNPPEAFSSALWRSLPIQMANNTSAISLPNPHTPMAFLPPELAYQVTISIYILVGSLGVSCIAMMY